MFGHLVARTVGEHRWRVVAQGETAVSDQFSDGRSTRPGVWWPVLGLVGGRGDRGGHPAPDQRRRPGYRTADADTGRRRGLGGQHSRRGGDTERETASCHTGASRRVNIDS